MSLEFGGKALIGALIAYIAFLQSDGFSFRPSMERLSSISVIEGFKSPYGLAIFPEGTIYVADPARREVVRIAPDGARHTAVWFPEEDAFPHGTGRDAAGTLYIPDHRKGRISRIATDGKTMTDFTSPDTAFAGPVNVYVDARDRVWVTDYKAHRVFVLQTDGRLLRTMGSDASAEPGQFDQPHMVAFDERENVYVADVNNHRIQKFDAEGAFIGWIGARADGSVTDGWAKDGRSAMSEEPGGFNRPTSVTVADGWLIVADTENNRVVRYDAATGAFRGWIGGTGNGASEQWAMKGKAVITDVLGGFHNPFGAQIHDGKLYVADTGNGRIQIIPLE